jgi:hypothetical protein
MKRSIFYVSFFLVLLVTTNVFASVSFHHIYVKFSDNTFINRTTPDWLLGCPVETQCINYNVTTSHVSADIIFVQGSIGRTPAESMYYWEFRRYDDSGQNPIWEALDPGQSWSYPSNGEMVFHGQHSYWPDENMEIEYYQAFLKIWYRETFTDNTYTRYFSLTNYD